MRDSFSFKDEHGRALRRIPKWENILDYYDPKKKHIFDLLEGETEEEKNIRLQEIKDKNNIEYGFDDNKFKKLMGGDIVENYNMLRENIIKISNEIIKKIENNTLTKNDIDIFLEKYENLVSTGVHNVLKIGIKQHVPKIKIAFVIISIISVAITTMSLLIHFLRKKTHKSTTKKSKHQKIVKKSMADQL